MKKLTYYRFKDGKTTKCLLGLFFFVILLLSRNTLYTSTVLGFRRAQLAMFGLIGILGLVFLLVNRKNLRAILTDGRIPAAIIFTLILTLPMVAKGDWQAMYVSILLCLYVAVFVSYFLPYREVAAYFVLAMTFLGAYSVVAEYILDPMVSAGWFSVPSFSYHESRSFHNFYLSFVVIRETYFRNYGIFREPGLYQFFLILALYLANYRVTWQKKRHLWAVNGILAVTMVSTFSTGGVLELGLLAVVLFFEKKLYRDKRILALVLACGAVGVLGLVFIIVQKGALYQTLFTMVEKLFVVNDSSGSRYEAIASNVSVFLQHPLFGGRFAQTLEAVRHNTSSTTLLFAVYGILGGLLHVAGFGALVWDKERHFLLNGMLVLILLMAVNTQNFTTDVFFWLFPTMALMERGIPLLKRKGS